MHCAPQVWLETCDVSPTALGCRLEGVGGWGATGHWVCRKLLSMITPETLGILLRKERNVHSEETQSQSVT